MLGTGDTKTREGYPLISMHSSHQNRNLPPKAHAHAVPDMRLKMTRIIAGV